jgi:hypothetical protein
MVDEISIRTPMLQKRFSWRSRQRESVEASANRCERLWFRTTRRGQSMVKNGDIKKTVDRAHV